MPSAAVAIITYRRPGLLDQALTAWAAGTRRPDQVVVVDASPDAAARAAEVVRAHPGLFAGGSRYLVAPEPATTDQRNAALDAVATDVVVFADDDTVPGARYLERLLEVFERDGRGRIGGVAGVPGPPSPAPARLAARAVRLAGQRYAMPHRVAYPPAAAPPVLVGLPLERRRGLNGCNMAFRTELVAAERFDERMRGWAYGEDMDLSFRVGRRHALVARTDARVELGLAHGAGVDPDVFFMARWVNPAYLIAKHGWGERAWRSLYRLLLLSRAAAGTRAGDAAERHRRAARAVAALRRAGTDDALARCYLALQEDLGLAARTG